MTVERGVVDIRDQILVNLARVGVIGRPPTHQMASHRLEYVNTSVNCSLPVGQVPDFHFSNYGLFRQSSVYSSCTFFQCQYVVLPVKCAREINSHHTPQSDIDYNIHHRRTKVKIKETATTNRSTTIPIITLPYQSSPRPNPTDYASFQ